MLVQRVQDLRRQVDGHFSFSKRGLPRGGGGWSTSCVRDVAEKIEFGARARNWTFHFDSSSSAFCRNILFQKVIMKTTSSQVTRAEDNVQCHKLH
jgi:hypothetical protein